MIDLWGLLFSSVIGLIVGMLLGLIPGLGVSSGFLLLAPVLAWFHPIYGLFVFVSVLVTSQYFGSITALVYGVPGEVSSYPVIAERSNLLTSLDSVLKQTALGSLIGCMIALLCFVCLMALGHFWIYLYNYRVFAWVIGLAVVACVLFGSSVNPVWINAVLFVIGLLLAKIGFNQALGSAWGTFGITDLYSGLPLAAVALGFLVIPSLRNQLNITTAATNTNSSKQAVAWPSIGRGSLIGVIGGLVPGVTYMASTQLSYFVENHINRRSSDRPLKSVIATSSADNAGATSSLYPLLWLGIPISLGEAMVVWLFDKQNLSLNWSTMSQPVQGVSLYWVLILCFVLVNLASYLLSWPGRRLVVRLAVHLLRPRTQFVVIAMTGIAILFLALESINPSVFWITLIVAGLLGLVARSIDWMPLIIGFILQDSIESTLLKLGVITI